MLYRQKYGTFIRNFDDFGYIINKCNFTDQVTDKIGAVFLSSLSRTPKTLQDIVEEIAAQFSNPDISEIEQDVKDFFYNLEQDGFIVSGETSSELDFKDNHFSYSISTTTPNSEELAPVQLRTSVNSQKYLENHLKSHPTLISFQIEITNRCNERCVHCYIPHENKNTDIESELFYNVLAQCKDMGVMDITLSGGEPMLHPHFLEFLHKAKENDFSVTVLSNLTLLNDDIISEMKSICLSGVQVSLYSMDANIHDAITKKPGSFLKTKNAILKLIENDIPVQISCPTMKQNKNCYNDVAKWAAKHGIRAYTDCVLMARYDHTTDNLNNRMQLKDMSNVINDIIENDIEYQNLIQRTDFTKLMTNNSDEDIICGVGIMSLCMVSSGEVYPCAGWQDYICGNISDSSLNNIWRTSPKLQYLRSLRKKDLKDCRECSNQLFCAVCMARNANENADGDPLKINKNLCEIAELNKNIVLDWKRKLQN